MVTILGNQYEGVLSKIKLGNKYYAIQDLRIGQVPQKTVDGSQVDQTVIEYIQTLTGGETGLGARLTYLEGKFLIQKPGLDDYYSLVDYLDHYTETELDVKYANISYQDTVDGLVSLHANKTGDGKKTVAEEIADYKTSTLDNVYAAKNSAAFLGGESGSSTTADFDPQTDTVWIIPQVLGSAAKAQARQNIGAQETFISGTNIKTINNESILGQGNITIQGSGEENVIETVKVNGTALNPDANKAVDITVPAAQIQSDWNATSGMGVILNKPTIPAAQVNADWNASSGVAQILNKPTIPTVPTALSAFTDDLGSSPTHTHSQYLTSAPVTSVNGQTGAVSLSIPTVPSNVSAFTNDAGYTTNTGTVTSTGGTVAVNNIQVVSALPASPDTNTLYLIIEQ